MVGAKRETLVVDMTGAWPSDAVRDLVLDGVIENDTFKTFLKSQVLAEAGVPAETLKDLLAVVGEIVPQLPDTEKAALEDELARFQDNANRMRTLYSLDEKPNPDAVFWPDRTGHFGRQAMSLADVLPMVENYRLVTKSTPIGSAGSCFAVEIARNLIERGFNYVVKEKSADPETGVYKAGDDPDEAKVEYSCNWGILFNTPSFRQIAEKSFDVKELPRLLVRLQEDPPIYSDPYREAVFFPSVESYEADYERHRAASRAALNECEVFIITLGLNEFWEFMPDGSAISRNPRNHHLHGLLRHRWLSVEENVANIQAFIDIVKAHNPGLKLIISVSPVPFLATGRADTHHVISANTHSKSVLRVAADELAAANEDVYYFPSYEMVTVCCPDPWEPDQRHVTRAAVDRVMTLFDAMFVA